MTLPNRTRKDCLILQNIQNRNKLQWLDICFNAMLEYIPENFTTAIITERFRLIAEHIDTVGSYLFTETTTDDNIAKFYSMAGIGHKEISNYGIALDYYSKAVSIRLKNNNEKSLGLVYNNIAVIYNIKAMYALALEYNHKSITISEKLNAPPTDLTIAYNNLAIVYLQCTSYDKALEWNAKALSTIEKSEFADSLIIADIHLTRATICYAEEKFEEALELDFRALNILKAHYSEETSDIGAAYNSIAREYFSLKQYDFALEYYVKVKDIYENVYGKNDSDTAEVYASISKTYMALQDFYRALEWCLLALKSQINTLGEGHPEVILRHSLISEIYEYLELYEDAISHLLIIRDFYAKLEHSQIVGIVNGRIADNYERMDKHSEASKYRKPIFNS